MNSALQNHSQNPQFTSQNGNVIAKSRNEKDSSKVKLLLSEVDTDEIEVPDPYFDSDNGFENVYHMIDQACNTIVKKLENHIQ